MGSRAGARRTGPKCIALVGPFSSGKTTLLEAILARTGAIARPGSVAAGTTTGDHSAEARAHLMSVEATVATCQFMGESLTFVDCPGSVEFAHEAEPVLSCCDLAVVVAEADEKKIPALQLVMRRLESLGVPRMLFLNKVDKSELPVREVLKLLQPASATPLLLRQIPLRKDGIVIGSIDLAQERAYVWREHAEAEMIPIPDEDKAREIEARYSMLETLADHDDGLMEQLLDEIEPPKTLVFDDLSADLRGGVVTPVFIGAAERGNGVLRLLKSIRHDGPDVTDTARRLGVDAMAAPVLQILKTFHTPHGGKLSVTRVLSGAISDAMELTSADGRSDRISGICTLLGKDQTKIPAADTGSAVGLGKLDHMVTGDTLGLAKAAIVPLPSVEAPSTVFSIALRPKERKDEVKLSAALQKLSEEDPSLRLEQNQDSGETVLSGHGEMHLRVTLERLEGKYQIAVDSRPSAIPYRETITRGITQRGRHRKQSGGHGQFGDVVLEIRPLPRGEGISFTDTITGGVVPKQYIASVEQGVAESVKTGPLGFPVVDLAVNLSDGSYHSVDSSDMAFQLAARLAMREGLAACGPVLLEPIMKVEITTPSDATARVTAIVPQRRGQIVGFDARPRWPGWDVVEATMPLAEMRDLIIELRSATAGVASYIARFDHMAELTGRLADQVLQANGKAA